MESIIIVVTFEVKENEMVSVVGGMFLQDFGAESDI
jgi:hypothetical protein